MSRFFFSVVDEIYLFFYDFAWPVETSGWNSRTVAKNRSDVLELIKEGQENTGRLCKLLVVHVALILLMRMRARAHTYRFIYVNYVIVSINLSTWYS